MRLGSLTSKFWSKYEPKFCISFTEIILIHVFLLKKHFINSVPVTECKYRFNNKNFYFYVFGTDRQVWAKEYPNCGLNECCSCCCGVCLKTCSVCWILCFWNTVKLWKKNFNKINKAMIKIKHSKLLEEILKVLFFL